MAVTKTWVSATPKKNADGNVTEWSVEYKYTDGDFSHTFRKSEKIDVPSKAPEHNVHKNPPVADTVDASFDINSLEE
jgi:hypothetical protein